jgi:hypothetical protein
LGRRLGLSDEDDAPQEEDDSSEESSCSFMFSEEETDAEETDPLPLVILFPVLLLGVVVKDEVTLEVWCDDEEMCFMISDFEEEGEFEEEFPEEEALSSLMMIMSSSPSGTTIVRFP